MGNQIKELVESTVNSMTGMFTAESIVGDAVTAPDGTIILPIANVSFGVGGGGSEFKAVDAEGKNIFGGGVGAGAKIKPEGFLVVTRTGGVRFVATNETTSLADKLIDYAPEMFEKVTALFKKDKKDEEDYTEEIDNV